MKTAQAFVGARGTDSVTIITAATAAKFKTSGLDFCLQYLGTVTAAEVLAITAAGLAFMPVTYADQFDGLETVSELKALGLSEGCTVWLDLESIGTDIAIPTLKQQINQWATDVIAAGFQPGLYVGANSQLTSLELYQLSVVRYWHSESRILDRNGQPAEPACGYCAFQLYPTQIWEGVSVDLDFIQQDYLGRLPFWVVSS
jgi:Domain of unknown function (DUF1906)